MKLSEKGKNHLLLAIILVLIILSGIGMHQANMAKNVSRFVFEAAHKHNWFWADGWFELLVQLSRQTTDRAASKDLSILTESFRSSKKMTDCFSSLRNPQKEDLTANIVRIFDVSERHAKQIAWVIQNYSGIFWEIPEMMDATDHGSIYSSQIIDLLSKKSWYEHYQDFSIIYDNMKDKEKLYSDLSYRISEKADRLNLLFFCCFCFSVSAFFLFIIRNNHIKSRKKLQTANLVLNEKENSLERAQAIAKIGSWEWNPEKDTYNFSAEICRILEIDPANPPSGIWEIMEQAAHPDDQKILTSQVRERWYSGKGEKLTLRIINANTEVRWIEAMPPEMKDKRGDRSPVSMIGTVQDITGIKLAEEALRSSHDRFIKVLNSIDATIYVADLESYEILFMNEHMINSFGRDLTGEICWDAYRGESGPCPNCLNDRLVTENGEPTGVVVSQGKNPITGKYYINYDRAIEWMNGRLVKLQIATDITEMKQMEDQLRQAQKMESVGRLAGGIAHDFNNMLSIILGNTDIILEDIEPESPAIPHLNQIQKAARRSADLTRQLLAFARKQTIAPKVIDLNETVEGMIKMLGRLIGEDIELSWLPKKDLWPTKMDPSQVDQLLANLCVNARDAINGIGKVTIETDNATFDEAYCRDHDGFKPGDYIMISVSDNGSGMDKATLENIFEPFFTSKGIGEGTGLGLATVYGIVKQNKGFINVYSEPGLGTTFRIYLPRLDVKTIEAPAQKLSEPELRGNEVILLVEDEKAILSITTETLKRLGYRVLSATSPSEAIRIGKSNTGEINLLLTDVVMPEMNGRDLASWMKQFHPNIKCLYMSGYTANVIAHHGVLDEGVHFINKPFSKHDLAVKLRAVFSE